jgi:hypothetical protein
MGSSLGYVYQCLLLIHELNDLLKYLFLVSASYICKQNSAPDLHHDGSYVEFSLLTYFKEG